MFQKKKNTIGGDGFKMGSKSMLTSLVANKRPLRLIHIEVHTGMVSKYVRVIADTLLLLPSSSSLNVKRKRSPLSSWSKQKKTFCSRWTMDATHTIKFFLTSSLLLFLSLFVVVAARPKVEQRCGISTTKSFCCVPPFGAWYATEPSAKIMTPPGPEAPPGTWVRKRMRMRERERERERGKKREKKMLSARNKREGAGKSSANNKQQQTTNNNKQTATNSNWNTSINAQKLSDLPNV